MRSLLGVVEGGSELAASRSGGGSKPLLEEVDDELFVGKEKAVAAVAANGEILPEEVQAAAATTAKSSHDASAAGAPRQLKSSFFQKDGEKKVFENTSAGFDQFEESEISSKRYLASPTSRKRVKDLRSRTHMKAQRVRKSKLASSLLRRSSLDSVLPEQTTPPESRSHSRRLTTATSTVTVSAEPRHYLRTTTLTDAQYELAFRLFLKRLYDKYVRRTFYGAENFVLPMFPKK
eukprot:g17212.t1